MAGLDFDVLVVGAGPAGSSAARMAALKGVEVALLEEHARVGEPEHCAGLIHGRDLGILGGCPEKLMEARVKEVKLVIGSGVELWFKQDFTVLNRRGFDEFLALEAEEAGAKLYKGWRAKGVERYLDKGRERIRVGVEGKDGGMEGLHLSSRVVIGADGFRCSVGRWFGVNPRMELASCIQSWVRPNPLGSSRVMEVYVGREYAPGGYAWVVPSSDDTAKIGLGVRGSHEPAVQYWRRFLEKFKGLKVERVTGHCVPLSGPLERTYGEGFLLAGDAAGQVVPSSGAGIATSIICGGIAGEVAAEYAGEGGGRGVLSEYQRLWRRRLQGKFEACLEIKRLLDSIEPEEAEAIKEAFKGLGDAGLSPMRLLGPSVRVLLKRRSLIRLLPVLFKAKKHGFF
ncbi:MAG: NAD(P)/FAD-dependent oxidoreductase [Candidatus Bathyarchaeia archaeon]